LESRVRPSRAAGKNELETPNGIARNNKLFKANFCHGPKGEASKICQKFYANKLDSKQIIFTASRSRPFLYISWDHSTSLFQHAPSFLLLFQIISVHVPKTTTHTAPRSGPLVVGFRHFELLLLLLLLLGSFTRSLSELFAPLQS
jgi:hypothetical protein